jgi:hypothetical protein
VDVEEHAAISVEDDAALLSLVGGLFPALFGFELEPVPEDALAADTEVGTLFVGVLSDFVISLELRIPGRHRRTPELLEYLNDQNAGSAFVTFSTLDEHVWVSGNVDGRPLVPAHLERVVTYMIQAATAVVGELLPEEL